MHLPIESTTQYNQRAYFAAKNGVLNSCDFELLSQYIEPGESIDYAVAGAAEVGNQTLVDFLIEHGAKSPCALRYAVIGNHSSLTAHLLENYNNRSFYLENYKIKIKGYDLSRDQKNDLIRHAAENNQKEVMLHLINSLGLNEEIASAIIQGVVNGNHRELLYFLLNHYQERSCFITGAMIANQTDLFDYFLSVYPKAFRRDDFISAVILDAEHYKRSQFIDYLLSRYHRKRFADESVVTHPAERDLDQDLATLLHKANNSKNYAVAIAARCNDRDLVMRLIELGADVNIAADAAAWAEHHSLVNDLIANGACAKTIGESARQHYFSDVLERRMMALVFAAIRVNADPRIFIYAIAAINPRDLKERLEKSKAHPVFFKSVTSYMDTLLTEHVIKINMNAALNETKIDVNFIMRAAVEHNNRFMTDYLIKEKGGDVDIAIQLARQHGHQELTAYLLESKQKQNQSWFAFFSGSDHANAAAANGTAQDFLLAAKNNI